MLQALAVEQSIEHGPGLAAEQRAERHRGAERPGHPRLPDALPAWMDVHLLVPVRRALQRDREDRHWCEDGDAAGGLAVRRHRVIPRPLGCKALARAASLGLDGGAGSRRDDEQGAPGVHDPLHGGVVVVARDEELVR